MENLRWSIRVVVRMFLTHIQRWKMYGLRLPLWTTFSILEPLAWAVLWYVTASESGSSVMRPEEVMGYYWLIAFTYQVCRSWTFDTVRKEIAEGTYTKYLLWPSNFVAGRLAMDFANKALALGAFIPVWVIWAAVLERNALFAVPTGSVMLGACALALGIFVRFYLDLIVSHIGLITERTVGISELYMAGSKLAGGMTVPLVFLPMWGQAVARVLPFRYAYSFPVEVLQGTVSGYELLAGFVFAIGWLFLLIMTFEGLLRLALKRYDAIGI